jgi:hypothetical protein
MSGGFPKKIDTSPESSAFYAELGRQDMSFEQALAELVDNSISAGARNVEILLSPREDGFMDIQVADDGHGIDPTQIQNRIMRMGGKGATPGEMNEHGFGLKNSLSCLTGGDRYFRILTRDRKAKEESRIYMVDGPLAKASLELDLLPKAKLGTWSEGTQHINAGTGTRVLARTTIRYLNTTLPTRQGRPFERLLDHNPSGISHTEAITEHLGVIYRKWLDDTHHLFLRYRLEVGSGRGLATPRRRPKPCERN